MDNCDSCNSSRIISVTSHGRDCNVFESSVREISGYVLGDLNIGGGDDVQFDFCLNCGKIQGKFPRGPSEVEKPLRLVFEDRSNLEKFLLDSNYSNFEEFQISEEDNLFFLSCPKEFDLNRHKRKILSQCFGWVDEKYSL